jgi:hypothetical protein
VTPEGAGDTAPITSVPLLRGPDGLEKYYPGPECGLSWLVWANSCLAGAPVQIVEEGSQYRVVAK